MRISDWSSDVRSSDLRIKSMRFVTYLTVETEPRLGLLHDGLVVDVEYFGAAIGQNLPSTMLDFIDLGPIALRFLQEAVTNASTADFVGTSLPQAKDRKSTRLNSSHSCAYRMPS